MFEAGQPSPPCAEIARLVRSNPGQCTEREYSYIWTLIRKSAPSNILIFGIGRDSSLWLAANPGGRTVFLEDDERWIREVWPTIPSADIRPIQYGTRLYLWPLLYLMPPLMRPRRFIEHLRHIEWDVIVVDAPAGYDRWTPGRMLSIRAAALLAEGSGTTDVLVHDVDRRAERTFSRRFLRPANLVTTFDRLAHFRVGP